VGLMLCGGSADYTGMKAYHTLWPLICVVVGNVWATGAPLVATPSPWFEPNVGQAPGRVRFVAQALGYGAVSIRTDLRHMRWVRPGGAPATGRVLPPGTR